MIRTLVPLKIVFRENADKKWMPANMSLNTTYSVVAEQWRRRMQGQGEKKKEVEDLLLGFIGDDFNLTFVASYNCYVGEVDVLYEWEPKPPGKETKS